jgi:tRNA 2-(methylsulfanyl)-N6-isopentenyladenosine37 hydroxylase
LKKQTKFKLGLQLPTDPRWVGMAEMDLQEILTDHAYCELKAATACISLIQMYPERENLVKELSPVVTEEWGHFRQVVREMEIRGLKLGRQRKDEYVNKLMSFQNKNLPTDKRLADRLLTCALIEARSCERFRLLSLNISDENLRDFYHNFMVAEALHYKMFLSLAKEYAGEEYAMERWQEYLDYEVQIMKDFEPRGDRMH